MKLKSQWLILAMFSVLPYLVLGAAGAWWLYDSGWWLWWVAWAALVSLSGWPLMNWLRKRTISARTFTTGPSPAGSSATGSSGQCRPDWFRWVELPAESGDLASPRPKTSHSTPLSLLNLAREVVEMVGGNSIHARKSRPCSARDCRTCRADLCMSVGRFQARTS